MASIIKIPNAAGREKWVGRITTEWNKQIPSIFGVGNLLEAAQQELARGEWGKMIREELPFQRRMAEKLIAIATNDNLRSAEDASPGTHLPVAWTILYELTKLTSEQFDEGVQTGAIHPKMGRKDVKALRGQEEKPPKSAPKNPEAVPQTFSDWTRAIEERLTEAGLALAREDREDLFAHVRQHIDNLERKLAEHDAEKGIEHNAASGS